MAVVEQNPLAEGLERLPVHPTILTIFGATGDLSKRKLLPALYNLAHEGALPERFNLIGSSRGELSDEDFRTLARDSIEEFSRREPDEKVLTALLQHVRYVSGAFDDHDGLRAASAQWPGSSTRRPASCSTAPIYLSTSPSFFSVIVGKLGRARARPQRGLRGARGHREADRHATSPRPVS